LAALEFQIIALGTGGGPSHQSLPAGGTWEAVPHARLTSVRSFCRQCKHLGCSCRRLSYNRGRHAAIPSPRLNTLFVRRGPLPSPPRRSATARWRDRQHRHTPTESSRSSTDPCRART
jgi:hypothetical protein